MNLHKYFLTDLGICFVVVCFSAISVFAQTNCTGNGQCDTEVDGRSAILSTELELQSTVECQTQTAIVSTVDSKNLNNSVFGATLDPDCESTITVCSNDGVNLFPATVTAIIHSRLDVCGKTLTSPRPLILRSLGSVNSWPPLTQVTYEVDGDVTFQDNPPSCDIIIKAGSQLVLTAQ